MKSVDWLTFVVGSLLVLLLLLLLPSNFSPSLRKLAKLRYLKDSIDENSQWETFLCQGWLEWHPFTMMGYFAPESVVVQLLDVQG